MSTALDQSKSIFGRAIEIESAEERAAYLDEACRNQPELRSEVEGLLNAYSAAEGFMANPAAGSTVGMISERPGTVIGP